MPSASPRPSGHTGISNEQVEPNPRRLYLLYTKTAELHIQVTLLEAKGIVVKPSASALRAVPPAAAPAGYELVHEGVRKLLE